MKVIGNLTKDAIIRAAVSEGLTVTQVIGTPAVFEAAQANNVDITYDSNAQKVVIVFTDEGNSSYGNAIVGTVSGNAISYGSPVIFESAASAYTRIAYDANAQKVVVVYRDTGNSSYGTAIVGTVSGTSISFGSPVVFDSQSTIVFDIEYDSNAQKLVIIHRRSDNQGRAIVGTVSGTSISFGTSAVFNAAVTGRTRIAYDANAQKVVLAYEDAGNSSHGTAIVGTVSGTGISFGSEVVFEAAQSSEIGMTYDPDSQKIVIGYRDQGDSNIGKAIVGTVSGTSISFGTAAAFGAGNDEYITVVYDSDVQKIVVAYSDTTTNGKLNVGTVSGTSITFGDEVQFESGQAKYINAVYEPIQKRVVIAYADAGNSDHGTAVVTKTGYTQATGGTIADGKAVIVNANGTVSSVSQSSFTENLGAQTAFPAPGNGSNNWAIQLGGTYDSKNGKVIITFNDYYNSQRGTALVGTVSGTSVTWGTAVVFETGRTQWTSVAYDSVNEKIVVSYQDRDNSFYGKSIVGTVSGNSVTFGTPVVFESAETTYTDTTYDTSSGAIVVNYHTSSGGGEVVAGSVSGTSITFGSTVVYGNTGTYGRAVYHPVEECVVLAWRQTSSLAQARALTVSGTTITLGSAVNFQSGGQVNQIDIAYDSSSKKVVVVGRDEANNTYGSSWVGTVSGTTLSFASPVTFQSGSVDWMGIQGWHTGGVALFYDTSVGGSQQILKFGTISGTTITWSSGTQYAASQMGYYRGFAMDTDNNALVVVYNDSSVPYYRVYNPDYTSTNITTENFVGFMDGAALDGTNGEILSSCSIAGNQTSLTAGQTYFVLPTGALSLTAGSPSVTAGTAISSTELIVKG